jgi:hypothetical protein
MHGRIIPDRGRPEQGITAVGRCNATHGRNAADCSSYLTLLAAKVLGKNKDILG